MFHCKSMNIHDYNLDKCKKKCKFTQYPRKNKIFFINATFFVGSLSNSVSRTRHMIKVVTSPIKFIYQQSSQFPKDFSKD